VSSLSTGRVSLRPRDTKTIAAALRRLKDIAAPQRFKMTSIAEGPAFSFSLLFSYANNHCAGHGPATVALFQKMSGKD
jgi:hypothetical protein